MTLAQAIAKCSKLADPGSFALQERDLLEGEDSKWRWQACAIWRDRHTHQYASSPRKAVAGLLRYLQRAAKDARCPR